MDSIPALFGLWAEVQPLPWVGQLAGSLLALAGVVVALWLINPPPLQTAVAEVAGPLPWRKPTAWLLLLVCGLMLAGLWIDPNAAPRGFVFVWTGVALAVVALLLVAGYDLLVVRRRGVVAKIELLESNRAQLKRDLQQWQTRQPRGKALLPPASHDGSSPDNISTNGDIPKKS